MNHAAYLAHAEMCRFWGLVLGVVLMLTVRFLSLFLESRRDP